MTLHLLWKPPLPTRPFPKFQLLLIILQHFQLLRAVLDLSKNLKSLEYFPHCGTWKVGKFGKHAPAVATLVHSPLPITARENKDRSAQSVQDQASLSPAATRAGFSSPPRPQISIAHGIRSVSWSRLALSAPLQRSSRWR